MADKNAQTFGYNNDADPNNRNSSLNKLKDDKCQSQHNSIAIRDCTSANLNQLVIQLRLR